MRVLYKKTGLLFFIAAVAVSTFAGLFATTSSVSAASAALYIEPKARADAIASGYRVALALCTTIDGSKNMNTDGGELRGRTADANDIANGNWFYQGSDEPQVRIGYLIDPDNGQVQCRNLFDGHPVADTFGFESNIELACGIGYERFNGSNCINGNNANNGDIFTNEKTSKNEIYQKLDAKRKNATGGSGYNAIQYYVMAANTYREACEATPVVNLSDATADQKNNDDLQEVKVVTGTGKIVTVLYKKGNNGGKAFRNDEGDFHYINENCDWMKDRMNQYADEYAAWVKKNPSPDGDATETGATDGEEDKGTSCAVAGVGWIVCPVVNFMSNIVDAAYKFVASLLVVQPLATTNLDNNPTYSAWSAMRNIANVAFVIAFLMIIFAQLTSIGITNYGIKKMLPRLILAAVLVNVSYWVCAIAVDLSNIAGGSINDLLKGVKDSSLAAPKFGADSTGEGWTGIAGFILAGGLATAALLYIGLSALLPALIAALLAIVTVFLVLTIRQALIILLIVISPLAFVAYLLPNTENLFKKWMALFKQLLYMYPIISFLFGASALASAVVMNSANDAGDYKIAIQIMGALVSIIPLALTPLVMKSAGGVLNRIGGFVNNPNKGPFDRARKGAEGYRKNRETLRDARALNDDSYRFGQSFKKRGARRQAVLQQRERNAKNAQAGYVATATLSDDMSLTQRGLSAATGGRLGGQTEGQQLVGQMAKGGGAGGQNAALAQAINVRQSLEAEEVKAASATIQELNLDRDQLRELSMGKDVQQGGMTLDGGTNAAVRTAAMQAVVNKHDVEGVNNLVDDMGMMDTKTRQSFADALANSKEKPSYISNSVIDKIRQGEDIVGTRVDANGNTVRDIKTDGTMLKTSEQLTVNAINNNTYSADKIANGDKDELLHVAKVAGDNKITTDNTNLKANADKARTDNRLQGQIGKNRGAVDELANL